MFSDIIIIDNLIVTTLIIIVVLYLGSELPSRGHFLLHGGTPIVFSVTAVVATWISSVLGWLENAVFVDFAELILSVVVIADISWRLVAAVNTVSD